MKNILVLIITFFVLAISMVKPLRAETICTQSYGQPVVCGASYPEEPVIVPAGIADINPRFIGFALIGVSLGLFVYSQKQKVEEVI
ncbi:hypothetical protein A2382_02315 [Candidatus Woesebacteria bacterium RIFOXYB1_FULL_38_16]|uniref:Uncharacterized protein n=1 Tax=Candidatus Woesebacteria bacterium RIFOXYB1_FULL_38_16 TaxID=1802538 RepID=A0A1F8CR91_9BACT|nr:MAG: hypothetical protein A2191_04480 [Candidatus Woesebacteria bacterium RIFOXYA1_FULL_38_9]OGM78863.1 MAG: hypothetical protein A2382_02315 [Candidatus Woesebacteria bacterium RIFOXYB1_FULL_38_16]